jgi:hypothetical protein
MSVILQHRDSCRFCITLGLSKAEQSPSNGQRMGTLRVAYNRNAKRHMEAADPAS